MNQPFQWNPVQVTIARLDIADTAVDPVFKEPTNRKPRPQAITYPAQINFGLKWKEHRERVLMGDRPKTRARIVLRTCDLAPTTTLPMPQKGDKIIALYVGTGAQQTVDYLIEEVRPESPLNGIPLLIYCEFERDRERV